MSNNLELHISILDLKGWASNPLARTLLGVTIDRQEILSLPRERMGIVRVQAVTLQDGGKALQLLGAGWEEVIQEREVGVVR